MADKKKVPTDCGRRDYFFQNQAETEHPKNDLNPIGFGGLFGFYMHTPSKKRRVWTQLSLISCLF